MSFIAVSPSGEQLLFGRHAETAALRALLEQAREGHGGTALISGPGGIGKTSLLQWIDEEATGLKMKVRWGQCLPGVADPFFPIEQLFRPSKNRERADLSASDILAEGGGSIEEHNPHGKSASRKGKSSKSRADAKAKATSGARAPATALLDYLSILEREVLTSPFVLLLDDFHWADQDSVQALKFLSRNIRNLPVLMAVALREDEVDDPAFMEVLRDLRRGRLVTDFRLKGLNESAARQLLESIVQGHIDPDMVRTALRSLLERTGGNPYFLLETAHQLQEVGKMRTVGGRAVLDLPQGPGGSGALPVPASVSDLLNKRLLALSSEERELLAVAALLGQEFKAAPLKDVFHSPNELTERILQRLSSERGLIVQKTANEPRYAFAHALLWETVLNSISLAKKREWSEKLALWWEAHDPADVEKIAALHYEGGAGKKGLYWTEKAIAVSLQAHAHQRIERHFAIGLSLLGMDGAKVERKVEWGLFVVGQLRRDGAPPQLIEPMCRKLIELNPPEPMLCDVMLELASVNTSRTSEARQLLARVQRMVQLKPGMASPSLIGRIAVVDSAILIHDGKFDMAEEAARTALSRLPEGETYFRGLAHEYLGWICVRTARWDEADKNLEQGLKYAKAGNAGGLIPRIVNLEGANASGRGDLIKGDRVFAKAVEIHKSLGESHGLITALYNLSIVMAHRGDLDGAMGTAREALRVAEKFGLQTEIGEGLHQLGYVQMQMGIPSEALKFFRTAEKVYTEQGDQDYLMELRFDMAEAKGRAGDPAGALKDLADSEGDGKLESDEAAQLHIRKAMFLMATGAKEEAKAEVERALELSQEGYLRYFEGKALLLLANWESKFGSHVSAARIKGQAEKVLKVCGVIDTAFLSPGYTVPTVKPAGEKGEDKRAPHLSLSILRHLADHGGMEEALQPDDAAPLSLTQKGISDGLGIPRDRFSPILKRLSDKGLVTVRTQYVRGQSRQMKVYLLTRSGAEVINK
jgi:tetratricopeptide (TPR) repeat protein